MKLILDAGALIALERGHQEMWFRFNAARAATTAPISHGGVIGQVWRGGGARQVRLARALVGLHIRPLDAALGRAAGMLLARTGQRDVIDAALVLLARDGDRIITSDPEDLAPLARAADLDVELVRP
jgi:hypothetical protein